MEVFDLQYSAEILPIIALAFLVNVKVTLAAFAIASITGLVFDLFRRSPFRSLRVATQGFVEFVRSTPLLVQLFFLYFILPTYGIRLEALTIGVIGLGVHYACYLAEVYRAGIDMIPRAQWECGVALNFKRRDIWRRVILPQALPPIVPMLGNYLVSLIKDTPLLAAISVAEGMQRATVLGARSYQYLEPITLVGALMLGTSLAFAGVVSFLDFLMRTRFGAPYAAYY